MSTISSAGAIFILFTEAIAGRRELSTLNAIATRFPSVLGQLNSTGGTFLAPTNDAISQYMQATGTDISSVTEASARELISYHILPLSLRSTDLDRQGGALADTTLLSETFANLEGKANVVFASAFGSTGQETAPSGLRIYSGVGTPANVTTPDVAFDNGFLHVLDRVLNFPRTCTQTAETASLSTLLDALQTANLTDFVDTTPKFTCFAPTDAAFEAAGVDIKAMNVTQIADALKYHSIVGDVAYSTALEDGQEYQTLLGIPVTVRKRDNQLFINDVAVLQGNVIMSNGVAHVLSGVLSPPEGATPSTTSTLTTATRAQTTVTSIPSTTTSGTSSGSSNGNSASTLGRSGLFSALAGAFIASASGLFFL
ncbi:FAS1 domain-containing protein [Coprinellus micaceus]|uniref:FAS1 domain-containing protein n=1 Tax=Coprinellus micaceus TaxID=71717 RepID=A0A4Y7THU0_COPMI|nr:FAS1 domain-containing protein [Coprinellus micaceus]